MHAYLSYAGISFPSPCLPPSLSYCHACLLLSLSPCLPLHRKAIFSTRQEVWGCAAGRGALDLLTGSQGGKIICPEGELCKTWGMSADGLYVCGNINANFRNWKHDQSSHRPILYFLSKICLYVAGRYDYVRSILWSIASQILFWKIAGIIRTDQLHHHRSLKQDVNNYCLIFPPCGY